MKTVGRRRQPEISTRPSGKLLAEAVRANEALLSFPCGAHGFIPKGVYRFRTLAEANQHWEECLAKAMARRRRSAR